MSEFLLVPDNSLLLMTLTGSLLMTDNLTGFSLMTDDSLDSQGIMTVALDAANPGSVTGTQIVS